MKRKIVKQGAGGRTIFLPIAWVRDNHIEAGDEISLIEKDNELVISCDQKRDVKRIEVSLVDHPTPSLLRSVIASYYKAGYSDMVINYAGIDRIKSVNDIVATFTGLEIISLDGNSMRLKSFVYPDNSEVDNLIIKLLQMIGSIVSDIDSNWEKIDVVRLSNMQERNIKKIRDLALRNIHTLKFGGDKSYDYYDFTATLEYVSREFLEIAGFIAANKIKRSRLFDRLKGLQEIAYSAYLKKDYKLAHDLWVQVGSFRDEIAYPSRSGKRIMAENKDFLMHIYQIVWQYRRMSSRLIGICSIR